MDPVTLALAVSIIKAAADLAPTVTQALAKGNVSPGQQAALLAAQKAIAGAFSGPEWQVVADVKNTTP